MSQIGRAFGLFAHDLTTSLSTTSVHNCTFGQWLAPKTIT
ncbi:hypothetical protein [Methylomonas fluvii]|nr:hypothetical protein [Methylomonas fluvii]